jgi:hypothetical protein
VRKVPLVPKFRVVYARGDPAGAAMEGERRPRQDRNHKAGSQPKRAASRRRVFLEPFFRCRGERYRLDLPFLDAVGDEKRWTSRDAIRTENPI